MKKAKLIVCNYKVNEMYLKVYLQIVFNVIIYQDVKRTLFTVNFRNIPKSNSFHVFF